MPYQPYSATMQALQGLSGSLDRLSAIDLARSNARAEHSLAMTKLGLQKQELEGNQKLSLLNAERSAEDRAFNREYQGKQLGFEERRTKIAEDEAANKAWMGESGNFEDLYRGSMQKQGLPPEQIDKQVKRLSEADPYGYGKMLLALPTRRDRMYDLLNDYPRMVTAEAARQRAERANGGTGGSVLKTFESQIFKEMNTRHGNKIALLNKEGAWQKDASAVTQIKNAIEDESGGWVTIQVMDIPSFDKDGQPIQTRGIGIVTKHAADKYDLGQKFDEIKSRHPYLVAKPDDNTETILNKARVIESIANNPTAYGNPNEEQKIISSTGLNTFKTPEGYKPVQPLQQEGQKPNGVSLNLPISENIKTGYFEQGGGGVPRLAGDIMRSGSSLMLNVPKVIPPAASAVANAGSTVNTWTDKNLNVPGVVNRLFPQYQETIYPALEGAATSDFAKYPFGKEWATTPVVSGLQKATPAQAKPVTAEPKSKKLSSLDHNHEVISAFNNMMSYLGNNRQV
jgi:hypothetical protein